jgi:hypothetical protein
MKRYRRDKSICDYDAFADVLYVTFKRVSAVVGNDTPKGFIVRRSRPTGEVVGVTILDYTEQFGQGANDIEIDFEPPFVVEVNPVDCQAAAFG